MCNFCNPESEPNEQLKAERGYAPNHACMIEIDHEQQGNPEKGKEFVFNFYGYDVAFKFSGKSIFTFAFCPLCGEDLRDR